jgi:hypothetical protein
VKIDFNDEETRKKMSEPFHDLFRKMRFLRENKLNLPVNMVPEPSNEEKKEIQKKLEKHARLAVSRGWCIQCQRPWYDGICKCGNSNSEEVKEAMKLGCRLYS